MPREVRMTTPRRLKGSGPRKELKTPGVVEMVSSVTLARPSIAASSPPLALRTARMTAVIPNSMMIP